MIPSSVPGSLHYTLSHYRLPLIVVTIGVILSIGGFALALDAQTDALKKDFMSFARLQAAQIDDMLVVFQEKIRGVRAVSEVLGTARAAEIRRLTESMLHRIPFAAIGWLPNGPDDNLSFVISPTGSPFSMSMADIAKTPQVQDALRDSKRDLTISLPFDTHTGGERYVALLAPQIEQGVTQGTVAGLISLNRLFSASTQPMIQMEQATIYLFNRASGNVAIHVIGHLPPQFEHAPATLDELYRHAAFYYYQPLQGTQEQWSLLFVPTPQYLLGALDIWPWIVLLGGLAMTGLFSFVTFQQTQQGLLVTRKVEDQTQQLRDGANRIHAILDTVPDGLITIDSRAIVQSFNAAAERIFGYKPEEVIGRNIRMLMPEPYHAEHDSYVLNYLETGVAKVIGIGREVSAKRKDGSIFPMDLGVNEFHIGSERAFVGLIRDITARKEAEMNLIRYTSALERSNKELDDFAYIASHDLKEPLRGLFNNARFLEQDYQDKLDKDGVARLRRLGYLTQRMEKLVNDLLYFSRLGRQELAIQPTDLNAAIRDIESMIDVTMKEQNATILIPRPLPGIVCDKTRVTEIFRNLIVNGIKYNDRERKIIEIGCVENMKTQNGIERQVFYVKDNGIGIEAEFHEEIFRIFKRLNEEDDSRKGTGVGLTFVRKIVERHGGRIWLESEPGNGTTFYFTLTQGAAYAAT